MLSPRKKKKHRKKASDQEDTSNDGKSPSDDATMPFEMNEAPDKNKKVAPKNEKNMSVNTKSPPENDRAKAAAATKTAAVAKPIAEAEPTAAAKATTMEKATEMSEAAAAAKIGPGASDDDDYPLADGPPSDKGGNSRKSPVRHVPSTTFPMAATMDVLSINTKLVQVDTNNTTWLFWLPVDSKEDALQTNSPGVNCNPLDARQVLKIANSLINDPCDKQDKSPQSFNKDMEVTTMHWDMSWV